MTSLSLPCCSFLPFPCVLTSVTGGKRPAPASAFPLPRELQRAIRSPLASFSPKQTSQVFSQDVPSSPSTSFASLSKRLNVVMILCSLCPGSCTREKADLLGLIFHCFNADSADESRSPPKTQPSCVHRRCQCHQCMNNTCPCSGIVPRLGRMEPTNH